MPPSWINNLVNISSAGYYVSDYPSFLAAITEQYQGIYGSDVYLGADSQDGQWLAIQAQAFYDTAQLGASVYNSFSPLTAQGVGLSRIVKINGLTRMPAAYSTVTLTVTGTVGLVITNGIAQDTLQQLWLLPSTVTIGSGGTATCLAVAATIGAVAAAETTITTIYTPTFGWTAVTNASPATPGVNVESDAALRIRQSISTGIPAQTPFESQIGRVGNVPGVESVFGWENYTDIEQSGTDVPPNSICIAVVAPTDTTTQYNIAAAIFSGKTPGCGLAGNLEDAITVYDSQGVPNAIQFVNAVQTTIWVAITYSALNGWSSTTTIPLIQNAVAQYLNALPIGAEIFASNLYAPALLLGTPQAGTFVISNIVIGKTDMPSSSSIDLDQGVANAGAEYAYCVAGTNVSVTA